MIRFDTEPPMSFYCSCCGKRVYIENEGPQTADENDPIGKEYPDDVVLCEYCLEDIKASISNSLVESIKLAVAYMEDTERAVLLDDDLIAGDAMDEAMEKIRGYYK